MANQAKKKSKSKISCKCVISEESGEVENNSYSEKKPSMKTASDVISRLLWDDSLPQEKFTVGYLDRFDGIVEKSFTSLDWSDPAVVDNHTLALPKHRIVYFKYNNRKVWDKRTRLDIVFGSTGSFISIYECMAQVDEELFNFFDEDLLPYKATEDTASDLCVEIQKDSICEEDYDISERANFFIAARITDENTVSNLKIVTDYMKSREELLSECVSSPEIFHLTLCILKLNSPGDIVEALDAMKKVASSNLPTLTLKLEGLDNFRHRVVYARVENNENLFKLRTLLVNELTTRNLIITDKFSFVPHVTVAKLSRPVSRIRNSNFIDQYLYLKFEDDFFGRPEITHLHLCEMGANRREDGFYACAGDINLCG